MCSFFIVQAEGACTIAGALGGAGGQWGGVVCRCPPCPLASLHPPSSPPALPPTQLQPLPLPHAGFLSIYMRAECKKSCQRCMPDSQAEAPQAPVVARPPSPACDKAPDAGTACAFFFSSLAVRAARGKPGSGCSQRPVSERHTAP